MDPGKSAINIEIKNAMDGENSLNSLNLDNLFDDNSASLEKMFPGLSGSLLLRAMERVFHRRRFRFMFFSPCGNIPILKRHPHNNRKSRVQLALLAKSIMTNGLMMVFRGEMQGVDNPECSDVAGSGLLFAAATISEALYYSWKLDPDNKFVQQAIREGVEGSKWDMRLPKICIVWVKNEATFDQTSGCYLYVFRAFASEPYSCWRIFPNETYRDVYNNHMFR